MEITTVKMSELHENPANPRTHTKRNLEVIKASLLEHQQYQPLVVQKSTMRVLVGNGRMAAMKMLEWEEVDCVILDIDDVRATALAIADNRATDLSGWDEKVLATLLDQVSESAEIDLGLTGFEDSEVQELLEGLDDDQNEDDKTQPTMEITPELLESHNYVVLYFDNDVDWQTAESLLDIKMVHAMDSRPGYVRAGKGRVLRGADVLRKLGAIE